MLARHRTALDTARVVICTVLAVLVAATPLGSLAHLKNGGSDFRPDLCTAATSADAPLPAPESPASHADTHARCGDCSTCGIGFATRVLPGTPAILVVAVRLDPVIASAPLKSVGDGIVARPRGPPLLS